MRRRSSAVKLAWLGLAACGGAPAPIAPPASAALAIDRFSAAAAHLMIRDAAHPLPAAGAPIDLDVPPFVTQGLGPDGHLVRYYNFDVQRREPDMLYRLVRPGSHEVIGELVDAIPGDAGYNDFHRITWVEVATGTPTSVGELRGLPATLDPTALDCPIVPRGTTGKLGGAPRELWYRGEKLVCLAFGDPLVLEHGQVPTSPIYVTFGTSGFQTDGTPQTHNVVFSLPGDTDYSPLWAVHVYDRAAFASVHDAASAEAAPLVEAKGPLVNCPVVVR